MIDEWLDKIYKLIIKLKIHECLLYYIETYI